MGGKYSLFGGYKSFLCLESIQLQASRLCINFLKMIMKHDEKVEIK